MDKIRKDGIEVCEDLCPCKAKLRLHTNTFGKREGNPHQKFYIDCEAQCGRVSSWKMSPEEALDAFDSEYGHHPVVKGAR